MGHQHSAGAAPSPDSKYSCASLILPKTMDQGESSKGEACSVTILVMYCSIAAHPAWL